MKFNWPVIGHDNIKTILQKNMLSGSVGHAYLFFGPEKVGKTYLAKLFAQSLICENYNKKNLLEDAVVPCGQCSACKQIERGVYPDIYYLERELKEKSEEKKANITVAQVRELIDKINMHSFSNSYKIVIVPEAETFGIEASNALLKTLEEPTEKTVIILIAKTKELILPTVQSRCQLIKFSPIKRDDIYDYLIASNANREEALELAALAQGRPTVALKLLRDTEFRQKCFDDSAAWLEVLSKGGVERFKFSEKYFKADPSDDDIIESFQKLSSVVRDLLLIKTYQPDLIANQKDKKRLEILAQKYSEPEICRLLVTIERAKKLIWQNISPRLVMETMLV
jgi:DNA polymerase-3 subunit delta'